MVDGKIHILRHGFATQIPAELNFNIVNLWVQFHNLPWTFLNEEWTVRILNYVGMVDMVENQGHGLPYEPYLRA